MNGRLRGLGLVVLLMSCGKDTGGESLTGGATAGTGGTTATATGGTTVDGITGGIGGSGGTSGSPVGGGTTAGTGSSAGTGTGSSFVGDGGACQRTFVKANRAAPDMLIVMDASGSMVGLNPNAANRWNPSVSAVNTVVSELETAFKFGLMTYPGEVAGTPAGCTTGSVDVPLAVMNAQPIANHLANTMPATGNTPTAASLVEAQSYLAMQPPTLAGEFPLPQYVMLVTDGDPNCVDIQDPFSVLGGGVDTSARQATRDAINGLASNNVLTYVIGYDTASATDGAGMPLAPYLDELAVLGNTGDMQHRSVTSGDQLLDEFRRITKNLVSCNFVLATPTDFSMVKVYLDQQETTYGEDWMLKEDGQTVELVGDACELLRKGASLEAEVVCEVVNII